MLKAQIRSKIGILGSSWQDLEDILTGDFFGTLDYLPRQPFLCSFMDWIESLNTQVIHPPREGVDWDASEIIFWPRVAGEDEWVEPDVVIVTDRWVLVVEVKLDSGLGADQPWREYCIGNEIARERGLPEKSVYYLLVSRQRLNIEETFPTPNDSGRQELLGRASQLLWHQAVALVERWLDDGFGERSLRPAEERMLSDLHDALRRRRAIVFSGFDFINMDAVFADQVRFFCPDRFAGFLMGRETSLTVSAAESCFLSVFGGFQKSSLPVTVATELFLVERGFGGFLTAYHYVVTPSEAFIEGTSFPGFLERCPPCMAGETWVVSEV